MTCFKPEGVRPVQMDEVALPLPVPSAVQAGISSVESLVSTSFPIANVGTPAGNSQMEYLRIRDILVESIKQHFSEMLSGTRGGGCASSGAGTKAITGKGTDRRRRHTERSDDTDDVVLISLDSWATLDHNIRAPDGFVDGTEVRRVRLTMLCFAILLMPVSSVQITSLHIQSAVEGAGDELFASRDFFKGEVVVYCSGVVKMREEAVGKGRREPYVRYIEDDRVVIDAGVNAANVVSSAREGPRQLLLEVTNNARYANHTEYSYLENCVLEDLNAGSDSKVCYILCFLLS